MHIFRISAAIQHCAVRSVPIPVRRRSQDQHLVGHVVVAVEPQHRRVHCAIASRGRCALSTPRRAPGQPPTTRSSTPFFFPYGYHHANGGESRRIAAIWLRTGDCFISMRESYIKKHRLTDTALSNVLHVTVKCSTPPLNTVSVKSVKP